MCPSESNENMRALKYECSKLSAASRSSELEEDCVRGKADPELLDAQRAMEHLGFIYSDRSGVGRFVDGCRKRVCDLKDITRPVPTGQAELCDEIASLSCSGSTSARD